MKRIVAGLVAALLWVVPALGQIPGGAEIQINRTPVVGGTALQCLYVTSANKVGNQACGAGTAADIKVGTTTVSSGTTTRVLYDNAGTLGEYTITGTGSVAMSASPAFTGVPTFGSIGTIISAALSQPAQAVVTAVGGSGGANYRYVYVAHGAATTAASPAMTDPVSGPAPGSLDPTHYLSMTPPAGAGITLYDIYRTSSNAPLTPGYIGSVAPGVEFRDTGIVATDDQAAPASDTGSAGFYVGSPLVASRSTESNFGHFQFGPYPHVISIGDTPSVAGAVGGFTIKDGNSNGFYIEGVGSVTPTLIFRTGSGAKPLLPGNVSGGMGAKSYEVYIGGAVLAWKTAAYEEAGTITSATALTDLQGKFQWGVSNGGAYGSTAIGMKLAATNGSWAPALLFTNGINLDMFNTGFAHPADNSAPTDYEVARGKWSSNIFNFGPVAGGTGTLRAMVLTGASVSSNGAFTGPTLQTGAASLTLTTSAVGLSKMTASASAPGAGGGKLELVCGTNAGSAKLIVYAGTSGTAVTVTDNIGTGVTGC